MQDIPFLHIVTYDEVHSDLIIKLLQKYFDNKQHFFLLVDYPEKFKSGFDAEYVRFFDTEKVGRKGFWNFYRILKGSQHIIWHGLYLRLKLLVLFYFIRSLDLKIVWVAQGPDLYDWEQPVQGTHGLKRIKEKLYNWLGRSFRKRICYFASPLPNDQIYFEKTYNPHARVFQIHYLDETWLELLSCESEMKSVDSVGDTNPHTLRILAGVNGSPLNKHIEILNSLVNVRYENIELILPLFMPGQEQYTKEICTYAELMYGEKACCITRPLSPSEYFQLLRSVDIVISRINSRVIHCHWIFELLLSAFCLKKTVFLIDKSPIALFFKQMNLPVRNAKAIFQMEFEKLAECPPSFTHVSYLTQLKAECQNVSSWRILFTVLEKEQEPVKFLHIIRPSEELATPIIELISQNFDFNEHRFLVNRKVPIQGCAKLMRYPIVDLFLIGKSRLQRLRYFRDRLHNAEHIIWHGFYAGYGRSILETKELLFLAIYSKFLKKTAWVGWGLDLHDWKADIQGGGAISQCKARLFNRISEWERRSIPNFISIFPPDGDVYRKQFGDSARIFDGTYSNMNFVQNLEDTRPQKPKCPDAPINIMVGHSANNWNKHCEILDSLAPFRYENVRIYLPLSTGVSPKYVAKVKQYAKLLFGKKAICIVKKMPLQNYTRFLWAMDIAVFRLERQAALGNLMNLMYMQKKIYLPSGTIMHDFFKEQGVNIYDSLQIADMSYKDFIQPNQERQPPQYVLNRTDPSVNIEKWSLIFNRISKNNDS